MHLKNHQQADMEMVVPISRTSTSPDFHFSVNPSTFASVPSSPKAFGNPNEYYYCYTSAPSSPGRAAAAYSYFATADDNDVENEFDFGSGTPSELIAADELFDKGQIRPSQPTPRLEPLGYPRESREHKDNVRERPPLSPPFTAPSKVIKKQPRLLDVLKGDRISDETPVPPSPINRSGSKKWSTLKDLLLFRSASEGRATNRDSKDTLRKYTVLSPPSSSSTSFNKNKAGDRDKKNGSRRPIERSSSCSTRNGSVGSVRSAHELHYKANRAAAEEAKRKTPLPYNRNSFFGCLHFNPAFKSITAGGRGLNSSGSSSRRQS